MKRLTVVISGAVSEGTFQAGVLYELLEAIRRHNSAVATEAERIRIDSFVGASAGAICAAVLANRLLLDPNSLTDPVNNVLRQLWVECTDMQTLLGDESDAIPRASLLSGIAVDNLAAQFITPGVGAPPARHPAIIQSGPIRLGATLTSLTGWNVTKIVQTDATGGQPFTYSRFDDRRTWTIDPVAGIPPGLWDQIKSAAIASAAFPFAFPVREVPDRGGARSAINPPPDHAYTDGGVLRNQPLGLGRDLVADAELADITVTADDRYYFYIAPTAPEGNLETTDKLFGGQKIPYFLPTDVTFLRTAIRLTKVFAAQSQFDDWIQSEKISSQVKSLDDFAAAWNAKIATMPAAITDAAVDLLDMVLLAVFSNIATLNFRRDRMRNFYKITQNDAPTRYLINLLVLIEEIACLQDRDTMDIYGVMVEEEELWGRYVHRFWGFLEKAYRDHDYLLGRKKCQDVINALTGGLGPFQAISGMGQIQLPSTPPPLSSAGNQALQNFIKRAQKAGDMMVDDEDVPCGGLVKLVVEGVVKKMFKPTD